MKPQPHSRFGAHRDAVRPSPETGSVTERRMYPKTAHNPSGIPHRRYPSLSEDGQPYFPSLRRSIRRADEALFGANDRSDRSAAQTFLSVRAIALVAIIVIIAALVAAA